MAALADLLRAEWRELISVRPSDRPWQLPFAAALAAGVPLMTAAALDQMAAGAVMALAALTFLYLPPTDMRHRMATIMACALGMIACYTIGLVVHAVPVARIPVLAIAALIITFACRSFRVLPPGGMFFIMAAAIAAFSPGDLAEIPARAGMMAIGCIFACFVAFLYSLYVLRRKPADAPPPPPDGAAMAVIRVDSVIIGLFVGFSLVIAELLALDKPYWVPVSCLAIIQGMSLRAAWNRQIHRIIGTALGLGVTWALLSFVHGPWGVAIGIMVLHFVIEMAVVRHYGFAVMFITPLTILLAEAPTLGDADVGALMEARFIDSALGAIIGFVGAACLHNPRIRARFAQIPGLGAGRPGGV
ncbi:hypothetical protein FHS61_000858 [Altererythrobacter atlanticus]|uniref:Integral membrane bound transporter domain-containing protein n=1 Tax=Croceibacterium atlanticum TaxID=1267766 RepID=A0A0F7KSQ3_9SPHN|nr:FUSC family protein [Croceibacterium atlanticum]AKH43438.1 hypothetical protein WYH_02408 [Croceibacterium atlanticum]MBB5731854.1 hypothetical protein [Croceibacterium atlanticum]